MSIEIESVSPASSCSPFANLYATCCQTLRDLARKIKEAVCCVFQKMCPCLCGGKSSAKPVGSRPVSSESISSGTSGSSMPGLVFTRATSTSQFSLNDDDDENARLLLAKAQARTAGSRTVVEDDESDEEDSIGGIRRADLNRKVDAFEGVVGTKILTRDQLFAGIYCALRGVSTLLPVIRGQRERQIIPSQIDAIVQTGIDASANKPATYCHFIVPEPNLNLAVVYDGAVYSTCYSEEILAALKSLDLKANQAGVVVSLFLKGHVEAYETFVIFARKSVGGASDFYLLDLAPAQGGGASLQKFSGPESLTNHLIARAPVGESEEDGRIGNLENDNYQFIPIEITLAMHIASVK